MNTMTTTKHNFCPPPQCVRRLPGRTLTVLNTDAQGLAVTLTTAHHFSGNITHPRQGFREMGVLIEYDL